MVGEESVTLSMLREGWQSAALEEGQPGGLAPEGVPRYTHGTCCSLDMEVTSVLAV